MGIGVDWKKADIYSLAKTIVYIIGGKEIESADCLANVEEIDDEMKIILMEMLDEIRQKYDLSILITTHDFAMLPRYANQVVLISHEVLRQGAPEEVLQSPEFARAFHRKGAMEA